MSIRLQYDTIRYGIFPPCHNWVATLAGRIYPKNSKLDTVRNAELETLQNRHQNGLFFAIEMAVPSIYRNIDQILNIVGFCIL